MGLKAYTGRLRSIVSQGCWLQVARGRFKLFIFFIFLAGYAITIDFRRKLTQNFAHYRRQLSQELSAERPHAQWIPIPKKKWKPIDARKFGYDVSVRPLYTLWG